MNFNLKIETKNQQIFLPILEEKKVSLFLKREDIIHPFVSGNKFRKLKYNLQKALRLQKTTLLTFGGAFSNHILATAVAGKLAGFQTIGIIRGQELGDNFEKTIQGNATLREAHNNGMKFQFVSREQYRQKDTPEFIENIHKKWGDFYLIPEGGTNSLAVKGCEEILIKEDQQFHYICVPVGTGGTISGLIHSAEKHQSVIGFPALKGAFLSEEIRKNIGTKDNWSLMEDYHFGGYAKYNVDLVRFINSFKKKTSILLDPIYTSKMIFGILDLIEKGRFKEGTKILAIHTGGIQGIEGFNQKLKEKNQEIIKII